jgi:hypothetical protein
MEEELGAFEEEDKARAVAGHFFCMMAFHVASRSWSPLAKSWTALSKYLAVPVAGHFFCIDTVSTYNFLIASFFKRCKNRFEMVMRCVNHFCCMIFLVSLGNLRLKYTMI